MSGDNKTTTTSSSQPWEGAQPTLKTGLQDAQNLYSSGVVNDAMQGYTGSTVVPWSDQTTAGMTAIQNQATDALANPGTTATGKPLSFYSGLYDTGGLSGAQQGVMDQLTKTASGAELNQTSPAFQSLLDQAANAARDQTNLSMSANGRYGSGAHYGALGTAISNAELPYLVNNYNTELQRQDAARTSLANLGQQGISNLDMASTQIPTAWTTSQTPATDLMKVGSMYEDLAGRTLSDNQRLATQAQQAPLNAVEWLNAIGSGAGSLGSSSTSTSSTPGTNPFLQVLAGGVGLNSLLNNPLAGLL